MQNLLAVHSSVIQSSDFTSNHSLLESNIVLTLFHPPLSMLGQPLKMSSRETLSIQGLESFPWLTGDWKIIFLISCTAVVDDQLLSQLEHSHCRSTLCLWSSSQCMVAIILHGSTKTCPIVWGYQTFLSRKIISLVSYQLGKCGCKMFVTRYDCWLNFGLHQNRFRWKYNTVCWTYCFYSGGGWVWGISSSGRGPP